MDETPLPNRSQKKYVFVVVLFALVGALFGLAAIGDTYWYHIKYTTWVGPYKVIHELHFGLFGACGEDGGPNTLDNYYCQTFEPKDSSKSLLSDSCYSQSMGDQLRTARAFIIMGIILKLAVVVIRLKSAVTRRIALIFLAVATIFDLIGVATGCDFFLNRYCDMCVELRRLAPTLTPPQTFGECSSAIAHDIVFIILDVLLCAIACIVLIVERFTVSKGEYEPLQAPASVDTEMKEKPKDKSLQSSSDKGLKSEPIAAPVSVSQQPDKEPQPKQQPPVVPTPAPTPAPTTAAVDPSLVIAVKASRSNPAICAAEDHLAVACMALDRNSSEEDFKKVNEFITALEAENNADAGALRDNYNRLLEERNELQLAIKRTKVPVEEFGTRGSETSGADAEIIGDAYASLQDRPRRLKAASMESTHRLNKAAPTAPRSAVLLRTIDEGPKDALHPMRAELASPKAAAERKVGAPGTLSLGVSQGMVVNSVANNRQWSEFDGISAGCIIVGIGHVETSTVAALQQEMKKFYAGDVVDVQYKKPNEATIYNAKVVMIPK